MKNSCYYIAPVGDRTHDLPHTVASNMVKVSHALNHSATEAVMEITRNEKWKSLETRRNESRLTMMYQIVNQQVAIDPDKHLMKPQKQSRAGSANTNSYVVPYASTTSRQQSFFPRTIRDWNQLPLSISRASVFPRPRNFRVRRGFHDNLRRIFFFFSNFNFFFWVAFAAIAYYSGYSGGRLALH